MKHNFKFIFLILIITMLIMNNSNTAQGIYIPSGATFQLGGSTLELPGDWENHGTFIPGTGTVILKGGSLQRIINPSVENFYDLKIEKTGSEVIFENDVHVSNLLYVSSNSSLNLFGNQLLLDPQAVIEAPLGSIMDSEQSGEIAQEYSGNVVENLAALGIIINITTELGVTNVIWGFQPYSVNGMKSISRFYEITPTNNSNLNATLIFNYLENELNGLNEDKLELFASTDGGDTWHAMGGTPNPAANNVIITGINSFARITLGTDLEPPVILLTGGSQLTINRFSGEFIEPGYQVTDNYDTAPAVVVSGNVNTYVCGDYKLTYTATDKTGNSSEIVRNIKVVDDPNALANPFLYLADKKITIDKMNSAQGDFHSNGEINLQKGPVTYNSNLSAIGKITIDKEITIDGKVITNNKLYLAKDVMITGDKIENASLEQIQFPPLSFTATGLNVTVNNGNTKAFIPGSYGKVVAGQSSTLEFSSGEYFIEELSINKEAKMNINIINGPIALYVKNKITIDKDFEMKVIPDEKINSRYIKINTLGAIQIAINSKLIGSFYAPKGKISVDMSSQLIGSLCANEISIAKDVVSEYHSLILPQPLASINSNGESIELNDVLEAPEIKLEIPTSYQLWQNYPNPFNPATAIRFALPEENYTKLEVYSMLGEKVITLVDGILPAGYYNFNFDAGRLSSGIYIYRIIAGDPLAGSNKGFVETKKMMLLK
jgi:predicted acyltransferase (DUF342 family)